MFGISLLTLVPGEIGGAETYVRELTAGLAEHGTLDYMAFTPPAAPGSGGGLPETAVPEYRLAQTVPERALAMLLARTRSGPIRRRFGPLDAIHYPLGIALPPLDVPTVVTLQDLQHLDLPALFSRSERAFRRLTHERSARSAEAVIVPSQFTRRSVIERLGVKPERIHAIPYGVDHRRFTPTGEPREGFLLYPARPWPHKNHERLLEAFALLRRERPELQLVLTGGGHEGRPVPEGVEVRGLVSPDELVSLYRRAACMVFPSLYEGWGAPPIEAMACGCPVASSGAGSLPESCGKAAALFDPLDPEDMAAVVAAVLDDPEPYSRRGIEHAATFTWEATALAHEAVYRSLF